MQRQAMLKQGPDICPIFFLDYNRWMGNRQHQHASSNVSSSEENGEMIKGGISGQAGDAQARP